MIFASALFAISPAVASTIVLQAGPLTSNAPAASPDPFGGYDYVTASWIQTIGFDDMSIAFFGSGTISTSPGIAYLTTSFGPGTTLADQIASAPFDAPVSSPSAAILLFSGLSLNPGTYYITITANPGQEIEWSATSHPKVETAPGVTINSGLRCFHGTSLACYTPGTSGSCVDYNLRFSVTGNSTTPEPGTFPRFSRVFCLGSLAVEKLTVAVR